MDKVPFTKLQNRIDYDKDGNPIGIKTQPINELDSGCMYHDLAYDKYTDIAHRNLADEQLSTVAKKVIADPKSTKSDKWNSYIVKNIMDYKVKNKM